MQKPNPNSRKIVLFGHFGQYNFGNESTLQAILHHLRNRFENPELICVCTRPEATTAAYNIESMPIRGSIAGPWKTRSAALQLLRKIVIGLPNEMCQWVIPFRVLASADLFIVPGTGLLTDAFGMMGWGPYNIFKWSLIAKLCGCKVVFLSVGSGPFCSVVGKWLTKCALACADFRSYRDDATSKYLEKIGVKTDGDYVFPDLAFSLPQTELPEHVSCERERRLVGIGVMHYESMYGEDRPNEDMYGKYCETLVQFTEWLLSNGYDVRFLIGDLGDKSVAQDLIEHFGEHLRKVHQGIVINEPVGSVDELLRQISSTDVVVATRFHNVLLALLLNKPVISLSFHSKCTSLMRAMGLSEYCQQIGQLSLSELIEQFREVEKDGRKLKAQIRHETDQCRRALDEQYELVFGAGMRVKPVESPELA